MFNHILKAFKKDYEPLNSLGWIDHIPRAYGELSEPEIVWVELTIILEV